MKKIVFLTILILGIVVTAAAQDPGWPRQITKPGGTLVYYQPQVDSWQNYSLLNWRMAFSLTPKGGKPVLGAMSMQGDTVVNTDDHLVQINNPRITNAYFPSLDPATSANMKQLLKTFLPPGVTISLERVIAYMQKPEKVQGVQLNNDPPVIFVSQTPAILLAVDGKPVLAQIPDTSLQFVVNTHWPLFFDRSSSAYYVFAGQVWMTAKSLEGPWTRAAKLPQDMNKLPRIPAWKDLKKVIPPPKEQGAVVPSVYYSTRPSEMIVFDGPPVYAPIPDTQLVYATNTDSPVFVYSATKQVYFLTAGRWFSAPNIYGPWTFATPNLPPDFAQIPPSSPVGGVLASVPGTSEAMDAVLIAQIPTTMTVNPSAAAAKAKVTYNGEPQFAPIEGTSLSYATNTTGKVIKVENSYYLCLQGIWFVSSNPQGPWQTAASVPQVIYTIPPSSPVYNVTYVTQTATSDGNVQSSYTAGYFGAFVVGATVGAVVASGTGYYYAPYFYYPPGGYPVYHPYAATYGAVPYYNTRTGAYGYAQGAYGPYGGYTRTASYNPYTGTYARSGSVYGPYGSRSAGQAYNPYTGAYAATRQGSSPYAQWGASTVTRGGQTAYTQHYTTAQGTVARGATSTGGEAVAGRGAYNSGFAAKSSGGDLYAGKDGNVYRNTGSGWEKYGGGGNWNTVSTPRTTGTQPQAAEQQRQAAEQQQRQRAESGQQWRAGSGQMQDLQNQRSERQRGAMQSDRFQSFQRSGGAWGGRYGGGRGGRRR
jgi:hypothetical protein